MKKKIRDYNLEGKKVIIRVDFNVPIKEDVIQDDNRIKQSLETKLSEKISKVIDEKLEGMDDVVVELIRCKTDNETLKQKIVDLNKEIYQLKNEVNSFRSVGLGFYKKKEIYVWE